MQGKGNIVIEQDHLSDDEFTNAFESCELPNEAFHHRDHLRLAWIYLRSYGPVEAQARMSESIRRFAAHHGSADKYHETITVAWLRLVCNAIRRTPRQAAFEDVLAVFPGLLAKTALSEHYSSAVLESAAARMVFVEPDLKPIPFPALLN